MTADELRSIIIEAVQADRAHRRATAAVRDAIRDIPVDFDANENRAYLRAERERLVAASRVTDVWKRMYDVEARL